MTITTIAIGLGLLVLLVVGKYFSDSNRKDLGTMSAKWVAENNASHP
jgi:hypothetical protein